MVLIDSNLAHSPPSYVNQTVDNCDGYTGPNYLGDGAINALIDCNNNYTYMGYKLFNDGKVLVPQHLAMTSYLSTTTAL